STRSRRSASEGPGTTRGSGRRSSSGFVHLNMPVLEADVPASLESAHSCKRERLEPRGQFLRRSGDKRLRGGIGSEAEEELEEEHGGPRRPRLRAGRCRVGDRKRGRGTREASEDLGE